MRLFLAIATLALAAIIVACDTGTGSGAGERSRLTEELRKANNDIEQLRDELGESLDDRLHLEHQHAAVSREKERLAREVERLEASQRESLERETALRTELSELQGELSMLTFSLDEYRARHWRTIRDEAIGTRLDSITTAGGKTYDDVTIVEITEGSLKFKHADGVASVSFEDLPKKIQDRYAYSPTRFIEETISDLAPGYIMTPEEVTATGPGPVPPPPRESKPAIPPEIVRQQLAHLEKYVAELAASLKRAEAMRDNVHRIDSGSKIKKAQADKWKMTKELDAHVMVYRQRLGAAKRQVEILKAHLPAGEKP